MINKKFIKISTITRTGISVGGYVQFTAAFELNKSFFSITFSSVDSQIIGLWTKKKRIKQVKIFIYHICYKIQCISKWPAWKRAYSPPKKTLKWRLWLKFWRSSSGVRKIVNPWNTHINAILQTQCLKPNWNETFWYVCQNCTKSWQTKFI